MLKIKRNALLFLLTLLTLNACGPTTLIIGQSGPNQYLTHTIVDPSGKWFAKRIAIIDIAGIIHNTHKPGLLSQSENPVSVLAEKLQTAANDPRVKAIILRINSPGGTVTASDAMYREVLRFKKNTGKPVVVLMMDVAASGGYYVACAADHLIAYPTSITGSIGVIMQTLSFKPALDRIGIVSHTITSGKNKATGSLLSNLTQQQRQLLQQLVNEFYSAFVNVVKTGRPNLDAKQLPMLTDGRVFSGQQAAKLGLIDQVGDLRDAFAYAKKLTRLKDADLIIYHRPLAYVGSPYASAWQIQPATEANQGPTAPAQGTQINIAQFNLGNGLTKPQARFCYLWSEF